MDIINDHSIRDLYAKEENIVYVAFNICHWGCFMSTTNNEKFNLLLFLCYNIAICESVNFIN